MTPEQIESGAEVAAQAILWVLFNGPGTLKNGEVRQHIAALFGPEVDAELQRRLLPVTALPQAAAIVHPAEVPHDT